MGLGHDLDGILNQLAAGQGVAHPRVVHRDPVTHTDRRKFDRQTSGSIYARLNGLRKFSQMRVTGDNGVIGVDNTDPRAIYFPIGKTVGV